ncbi:wax ester synthase/diacylglycerol acyltransferase 11 [Cryptomeria japonica]|uniref:wax ester synthase/diacylglycerol acyltransferase 11 n=1 Tax=Cryptomeria japonica TaxID=3369 RepID=UPI0025AB618F|nr:wax ester synthase/diacylglycerol acyltransferase 11 [Cryptomeria japonica]
MSKDEEGPVSPMGEILNDPSLSLSVLCVAELDEPVDISQAKKAIRDILLIQNSRFSSIVTKDEKGVLNWEKTEVNVDDHVFVPHFPPHLSLYDKHVEEYISDLHLTKLDPSRPLWEYHFINYKTTKGEAIAILKLDHMLGDGASIASLTRACSTTVISSPSKNHTLLSPPSQNPQHPPITTHKDSQGETTTWPGFEFISRIWNGLLTVVLVMWYTLHDLITSFLRSKWMEDSRFPLRGHAGVELLPKVMASCTFTLQDIGEIKKCVDGTVNDVVMGTVFYGFQLYCGRVLSDLKNMENLRVTAIALMNTRSPHGKKSVEEMGKSKAGATKGNNFGFLSVAIPMKKLKNPLEYVRRAKHMFDKKKMSLAALLTGIVLHYVTRFKGAQTSAKALYNTLANTSIVVTNVSGPSKQIMLAGYKIRGGFFSVSGSPTSILVTCHSYMGKLRMQVITTKGYVDAKMLSMCFQEAFIDIKDASENALDS